MKPAFLLCIFLMATQALASDQLGDALNHQYKDRVFTFRQPMTAPTQQYDAQGNSPTASALGSWTIYGRIQIKKIKVAPTWLILEGRRIGMKFSDHSKTLVPAKLDDKMKVEIFLHAPLNSADQAREILGHIFAFTREDFLASVPEFWRKYLADNIESYADDGSSIVFKPAAPIPNPKDPNVKLPPGVFHVGKEVTPPQAIHGATPDPDYSDAARQERFGGPNVFYVIVGPDGTVSSVELARPLGLGLDEKSAQKIKTWKFQPAKRNGDPVPVEVVVEVSFQLW